MNWPDDFIDKVICGDCLKILPEIPDNVIDSIIIDPPYGILGTDWDKIPDIKAVSNEFIKILKPSGFLAVFGIFPGLGHWLNALTSFHFREHIVWVKRLALPSYKNLSRAHESIIIWSKDKSAKYHNISGPYEDVRFPGILVDTLSLETLKRHFSEMRTALQRGHMGMVPAFTRGQKIFQRFSNNSRQRLYLTPNYTNVWSFLPERRKNIGSPIYHEAQKPSEVIKRLIEMTTAPSAIILDCFLGSGTTALACKELNRRFIGIEIHPNFCRIAEDRLAQAEPQLEMWTN